MILADQVWGSEIFHLKFLRRIIWKNCGLTLQTFILDG
jgi:hypothetical protein